MFFGFSKQKTVICAHFRLKGNASLGEPKFFWFWVFTNLNLSAIIHRVLALWCSRLARQPVTLEVDGSSPFGVAIKSQICAMRKFCFLICLCSSVGRAVDWKSTCRWFDSDRRHHGSQKEPRCGCSSSGRAPPCQGGGSEFEPRHPLQKNKW